MSAGDGSPRRGATLWLTGLPAAGKTTLSSGIEGALLSDGRGVYRLDGDDVRKGLCSDLGFDRAARAENVRRVGHVARMLADAGLVVVVALVSPYAADRKLVRELHDRAGIPFFEVFVDTPLEVCRERDPKGMYARSGRGELKAFTGVDDPYEPPPSPELRLTPQPVQQSVQAVLETLGRAGLL